MIARARTNVYAWNLATLARAGNPTDRERAGDGAWVEGTAFPLDEGLVSLRSPGANRTRLRLRVLYIIPATFGMQGPAAPPARSKDPGSLPRLGPDPLE